MCGRKQRGPKGKQNSLELERKVAQLSTPQWKSRTFFPIKQIKSGHRQGTSSITILHFVSNRELIRGIYFFLLFARKVVDLTVTNEEQKSTLAIKRFLITLYLLPRSNSGRTRKSSWKQVNGPSKLHGNRWNVHVFDQSMYPPHLGRNQSSVLPWRGVSQRRTLVYWTFITIQWTIGKL